MLTNLKLFFLACVIVCAGRPFAEGSGKGQYFAGQDIHLAASRMGVYSSDQESSDEQILVFEKDFSLEIGNTLLSSERAVVWINPKRYEYRGGESIDYVVRAYLEGGVKAGQGLSGKGKDDEMIIEEGKSLVVHFYVSGEVFATAGERVEGAWGDLEKIELFRNASKAVRPLGSRLRISPEAIVPRYKDDITVIDEKFGKPVKNPLRASDFFEIAEVERKAAPAVAVDFAPQADTGKDEAGEVKDKEYQYPINISGVWERNPEIHMTEANGASIATLTGRFYLWQRRNESGDLIEFQADNGVIFYSGDKFGKSADEKGAVAKGKVEAVYFSGNIVMTEGERTIRSTEMFYDFVNKRALAVKAEMRNFDVGRGIPIYLRAAKLQQVAENIYQAENIVLTTSEFYVPQISMTASQLVMTNLTGVQEREGQVAEDSKYDAVLSDIRMKAGEATYFAWPRLRTNFERPDVPIRQIQVGHDNRFGTSVETRWYLSRLLGLKEPKGVDSSLMIDYFGKRGNGFGIVADYNRDDYFGGVSGYIIDDRGVDRLGRTRQDLKPDADLRGRFTARHRHYLPYNWQATVETSYISDKNFLESYYRTEFNTSKAQETLLHLKRIKDFWAFSLLNKVRINDFESELEELPTAELHFKGVSFWDNMLTYYGDTQVSRLRNRIPSDSNADVSQDFFTFFTTRHEVDMPMRFGAINIVPFGAGSYSLDDQDGFIKKIDNSLSANPEEKVLLGEAGVRVSTLFWKEDNSFRSEFWDVDGLRHTIKPHFEAVAYDGDSDVIEMRDFMNFGLSQRWQTRRGSADKRRTVDWMRLDADATFLSDTEDSSISPAALQTYGPAKFIWNDPSIPVFTRRDDTLWGMVRDSVNLDYSWRMSDTTVFLSDMNYDTDAGVIQQFNAGVARYVYPDISYYVGSRYYRPVTIDVPATAENPDSVFEQGSNTMIGSITYALNNRYTLIVSEEYNFDYGNNVRTEFALLRRYHRLYCGLTLSIDESREENSIMFSIWPQGVKDLTFGDRRYASFRDGVVEN